MGWSRKIWGAALTIRMLVGCTTTDAPPPEPDVARIKAGAVAHEKWVVGCNNLNVCTAIAPLREYAAGVDQTHIRMIFTASVPGAQSVAILRGNRAVQTLSPVAVEQLTEKLIRSADADIMFVADNGTRFDVPRAGFAMVWRLLQQWRPAATDRDLPTAALTLLPVMRIENPVVHPMVAAAAKHCPDNQMGGPYQAWRGIGGVTLLHAACGNEGLNQQGFWFFAGPQGAPPEPVKFEDPDGSVSTFNSSFDESSGYLRMFHYFGGQFISRHEDCGVYRAYAWTLNGMKLAEKRFMPVCETGIGPEGWITIYRAAILNGPDSGP